MKLVTAGCGCSSAPNLYQGSAVKDLPQLGGSLVELSTDFEAWVTSYTCFSCGQLWQERYEAHGHSNVPSVYKIAAYSGESLPTHRFKPTCCRPRLKQIGRAHV